MNADEQIIRSILIPETGLDLEPKFVRETSVSTKFSRVLAHIVGHRTDAPIMLQATSNGALYVASAGVPFEIYVVNAGTAADAYAAPNTFEFAVGYNVTDFLIETHPAIISFRNLSGVWLPDKILPVGMHSIDLVNYGIRIRNRNAGNNSVYEITSYR